MNKKYLYQASASTHSGFPESFRKGRRGATSLVIALTCLAFLGCENNFFGSFFGSKGSKAKEGIVAKVGNSVLTAKQFYAYIPPEYTATLTPAQKKQLADMWINTEILYQEALKQRLNKEEKMVLKLHEMERQLLANAYLEDQLAKTGSVNEPEIRSHFEQYKSSYSTERKSAEIVVNSEGEAKEIMARLDKGEDFSALAKAYSLAPSAKDGGVVGYLRVGDSQFPEIESIVFSLAKPGDISEPVPTKYGFVIIKLLDVKPISDIAAYENVKEGIRATLNYAKQKTALDSLLTELKKTHKVEEHYDLLGI